MLTNMIIMAMIDGIFHDDDDDDKQGWLSTGLPWTSPAPRSQIPPTLWRTKGYLTILIYDINNVDTDNINKNDIDNIDL